MKKNIAQHLYDFIGSPLRMIFLPDSLSEKLRFTSLEQERINQVLPEIKGLLLDIGCGNNRLVKKYNKAGGKGTGVDVFDWGGEALIVKNSNNLPFKDKTFDTITFIACLNHIPERSAAIKEAYRILSDNGICIVTMINPLLGGIGHKIWWYSEDKERGMQEDETGGMWNKSIIKLFEKNNFIMLKHKRFVYGLNNLLIFKKLI